MFVYTKITKLLRFLTYSTPVKFIDEFDNHYSFSNLKQVKIVSAVTFLLASVISLSFFLFTKDLTTLTYFKVLSVAVWIYVLGSLAFFLVSSHVLKSETASKKLRKSIVLAFIFYILTVSFSVTYLMSLNDTKNMITMYLVGLSIVSLFFAIEYRTLFIVAIYITIVFFSALVFPNIVFHQKILNGLAGSVLTLVMITFSRYSYYFKSSHFVKLRELEEKNLEILYLDRQKSEILSFVAHDLRAPLNNIEALSNLMIAENQDNDEAKMIVNCASHAKTIINDLIEAAKQINHTLPTQAILLATFVEDIIAKWQANTDRKIEVFMEDEGILLNANPSKIERVINNLISNAFKFSSIYKPIHIIITKNKNLAIIKVIDFGIGIPQHLQAHVFDQFSKAGREGLLGEKSIGLGLHISHKIIEQHQGHLSVVSKENEGTTFIIELPLASA